MKNSLLPALLLSAAGSLSGAAQAEIYQLDFTASNYQVVVAGAAPPQSTITGWFQFEAASLNAAIDAVTAVNLTINGHQYTTAEVGGQFNFGKYLFGEHLTSALNTVRAPGNDFLFEFGPDAVDRISYFAVSGSDNAWTTRDISYAITAIPAVPEPASMLMLLGGLGVLGAVARRRNRRA